MIYLLLIIIIIELAIDLYFHFKKLPEETQNEIQRKVAPIKTEVLEWTPPEDEGVKTSRELTEEITNEQ